ncbi:MAG: ADP-ribosylglycohydrolase family protein [Candidatus Hydrogenedentes bacterium]|nr:ADP-ribosylglycohydrolase family protein [Candidatus Hydrogenedentota bacterium]
MSVRSIRKVTLVVLLTVVSLPLSAGTIRLSKECYLDKCAGAWAGQMIGVCFGAPYEFQSNGKPITTPLEPWRPERIEGAIGQDDCYVEMTFLKALQDHGLDISFEEAGQAFAASQYPLWHANFAGRENVRRGLMPPDSGRPEHNRHADDIDFQIESDLFGIICPGLPQESSRLCDIFGHIMNYGDGVYGGMFVAGMYATAYFEDRNVLKVIRAGLDCIPADSEYHRCISDVIRRHDEHPHDWLAAWEKIEKKWQDDVDCAPEDKFNIDAKLNGAYIVMGLLYGEGDMLKTMEISARCGQDADCNPSNAAGVLGCMKGYKRLGQELTGGIEKIRNANFSHTNYSFNTLIPTCRAMAEKVIERAGGTVKHHAYLIPRQLPQPAPLEQWTDQMAILSAALPQNELDLWNPNWKVLACGHDMAPGVRGEEFGRNNVLVIHPVNRETPAVLAAEIDLPNTPDPRLYLDVASDPRGDFILKVLVNDQVAAESLVATHGQWMTVSAPLGRAKEKVQVRIENHANGWEFEAAYLAGITVK